LKCIREYQGRAFRVPRSQNKVFQVWEFIIDCHDKLPQNPKGEAKAEVADAMTLLESKHYPLFIFCSDAVVTDIVDDEREGR